MTAFFRPATIRAFSTGFRAGSAARNRSTGTRRFEIVSYDRVKLLAARPYGLDHIPRNFCTARALLNDSSYHDVSYSVAEDLGIIGFDYGVEWCVQGLDRNLAYAPACQAARP